MGQLTIRMGARLGYERSWIWRSPPSGFGAKLSGEDMNGFGGEGPILMTRPNFRLWLKRSSIFWVFWKIEGWLGVIWVFSGPL